MKDIKTLMIGFLLATCMFLMMGQGGNNSQIGKYQLTANNDELFLMDTRTSEMWIASEGVESGNLIVSSKENQRNIGLLELSVCNLKRNFRITPGSIEIVVIHCIDATYYLYLFSVNRNFSP